MLVLGNLAPRVQRLSGWDPRVCVGHGGYLPQAVNSKQLKTKSTLYGVMIVYFINKWISASAKLYHKIN